MRKYIFLILNLVSVVFYSYVSYLGFLFCRALDPSTNCWFAEPMSVGFLIPVVGLVFIALIIFWKSKEKLVFRANVIYLIVATLYMIVPLAIIQLSHIQ